MKEQPKKNNCFASNIMRGTSFGGLVGGKKMHINPLHVVFLKMVSTSLTIMNPKLVSKVG
jgi:hypothetical protein